MTDPGIHDSGRPPRRKESAAFRLYEGEATIILPDGAHIKVLNQVGSLVWDLLDGTRSVEDLASLVAEEFEVEPEVAERDVREFLDVLASHDMLE